jgi:predicted nuclease of predicted toxin-antitoxin system
MARLYADEDIPRQLVERLRDLGHDIVSVVELSRQQLPDAQVLADAVADSRVLLTHNRRDFERLHRADSSHLGIVSATRDDANIDALASRIDATRIACPDPAGQHIRVNKRS